MVPSDDTMRLVTAGRASENISEKVWRTGLPRSLISSKEVRPWRQTQRHS